MKNKHFNAYFMLINYYFFMYSECNTVVLVKSFKKLFTRLKQRLDKPVMAN